MKFRAQQLAKVVKFMPLHYYNIQHRLHDDILYIQYRDGNCCRKNWVTVTSYTIFISIWNVRATRLPLATKNVLIPKSQELICMFETLDCITLLDLPASFVIS